MVLASIFFSVSAVLSEPAKRPGRFSFFGKDIFSEGFRVLSDLLIVRRRLGGETFCCCRNTTAASGGKLNTIALGRYIHSSSSSSVTSAGAPLPPYFWSSVFNTVAQEVPSLTPIL